MFSSCIFTTNAIPHFCLLAVTTSTLLWNLFLVCFFFFFRPTSPPRRDTFLLDGEKIKRLTSNPTPPNIKPCPNNHVTPSAPFQASLAPCWPAAWANNGAEAQSTTCQRFWLTFPCSRDRRLMAFGWTGVWRRGGGRRSCGCKLQLEGCQGCQFILRHPAVPF